MGCNNEMTLVIVLNFDCETQVLSVQVCQFLLGFDKEHRQGEKHV